MSSKDNTPPPTSEARPARAEHRRVLRRRIVAYLGTLTTLVALPTVLIASPAYAATLVFKSGSNITATASNGGAHNLTATQVGNNIVITDTADVVNAGAGCVQAGAGVSCPLAASDTVVLNGASGNDTLSKPANVRGHLKGGAGNDTINGGPSPGANVLDGGPGNDTINGGTAADSLIGGTGADRVSGGPGTATDIVMYLTSTRGVVVDQDNVADDGAPGEGDNVLSDVEAIYGSPFNDLMTGNAGINIYLGFEGNDTLSGGGGVDTLVGGPGFDLVRGEAGNDLLETVDSVTNNDNADGGTGTDTCRADAGDVRLSCEL